MTTPFVAKAVAGMEDALAGLSNLLNAILDISRIDAGVVVPHMKNTDISEMVQRLGAEYVNRCRHKNLKLRCHCKSDLHAITDSVQLERIIRNLIENAIFYTERGTLLFSARGSGDRLRINVLDTGIGIPESKLTNIFEEFYQVKNPTRNHKQGLGLGLAIVKRLARLIGAEIQVRSREGRGSLFTVWLPASAASSILSIYSEGGDPIAGRHIMLIEDSPEVRIGFQLLLESWNCTVSCAESGEEALKIGKEEGWRFDAIIADDRLGAGMSGTQTAIQIATHAGRSIPTLIVTGDTAPERIAEIHASGFEIMHKPVLPDELSRRIAHLLR